MKTKLLLLHFLIPLFIFAQTQIGQDIDGEAAGVSKNNIFVDVSLGYFSQAAVNYERKIHIGEKVSWYGRLGIGVSGELFGHGGPGGLAAITMLTGKRNGHFEISAGGFIGQKANWGYANEAFANPVFNVGYRYQKPKGGFIFRTFVCILGLGIGAGYAF
jgi:hypothetical protein